MVKRNADDERRLRVAATVCCVAIVALIDATSNLTPQGGYRNAELQSLWLVGMVAGGAVLALFDRFVEQHIGLILALGSVAFVGCFVGCFTIRGEEPGFLLGYHVLLGIMVVVTKFTAIALVARFQDVSLLSSCIAWSQVGKVCVIWVFGLLDTRFQILSLAILLMVLLLSAFRLAKVAAFLEGAAQKTFSCQEVSLRYLVTQALFVVAFLATLRVLKLPDIWTGSSSLYSGATLLFFLFLPLVARRLFGDGNEGRVEAALRAALLVMLAGLLAVVLQRGGTRLLSPEGMGLLAFWLEGFGHVAFWASTVLLGWHMRGRVLRYAGILIALWALCVLLWRFVLGEISELATLLVVGIVYLYMVFATRVFPSLSKKLVEKRTLVDDAYLLRLADKHGLSEREVEVFLLLSQGRSRRLICQELFISDGSAKAYISRIYKKFGVTSKQELLAAVFDGDSASPS